MRNGSAAVLEPTPAHIVPWQNPDGDFTATYINTYAGRTTGRLTIDQIGNIAEGRLSEMPHGTQVLISGTIDVVRLFGEDTGPNWTPSATVRLDSGTGASVTVLISPAHYARIWGYLVMGRRFGLAGSVKRHRPDHPTIINFVRLLMTRTDTVTPEQYAAYAAQAVTL